MRPLTATRRPLRALRADQQACTRCGLIRTVRADRPGTTGLCRDELELLVAPAQERVS